MARFVKMHGLGNDFVILDVRENNGRKDLCVPTLEQVKLICDRRRGVGCDQLIVLEHSPPEVVSEAGGCVHDGMSCSSSVPQSALGITRVPDVYMRIFNVDGSEVGACGNATRCVAHLLLQALRWDEVVVQTRAGKLPCRRDREGVSVGMGPARTHWQEIPLSEPVEDTNTLPLVVCGAQGVAVNVGNPHCIFFLQDMDDAVGAKIEEVGRATETHALFPERTNVELVRVLSPTHLQVEVWERGVGVTAACGSAACACVVAAVRRGYCRQGQQVRVDFQLGLLWAAFEADGTVTMCGPATPVFEGVLDASIYSGDSGGRGGGGSVG